jgi:hypothetical protein
MYLSIFRRIIIYLQNDTAADKCILHRSVTEVTNWEGPEKYSLITDGINGRPIF